MTGTDLSCMCVSLYVLLRVSLCIYVIVFGTVCLTLCVALCVTVCAHTNIYTYVCMLIMHACDEQSLKYIRKLEVLSSKLLKMVDFVHTNYICAGQYQKCQTVIKCSELYVHVLYVHNDNMELDMSEHSCLENQ